MKKKGGGGEKDRKKSFDRVWKDTFIFSSNHMEKGISKVLLREIRRFSDCSTKCDMGSVFVTGSPILPGAQTPARTRRRTSSLETSSSSGKIENTLISSREIAGRSRGTDKKKPGS